MNASKLLLTFILIICLAIGSCTKQSETDKDSSTEKKDTVTLKSDPAVEAVFSSSAPVAVPDSLIAPPDFRAKLNEVLLEYIHMKQALTNNDSTDALMQSNQLKRALTNITGAGLEDKKKDEWIKVSEKIEKCCKEVTLDEKLANQRKAFSKMSDIMTDLVKNFGFSNRTVYLMYCSSENTGNWLVDTEDIGNPYLGISKPEEKPCAEVKEAWKFE